MTQRTRIKGIYILIRHISQPGITLRIDFNRFLLELKDFLLICVNLDLNFVNNA